MEERAIEPRVCKHCLLRDMGDDIKKIQKFKDAIRPEDRVSEDQYEERLLICRGCEKLTAGTCLSCGCYVELRALGKESGCPNKKW